MAYDSEKNDRQSIRLQSYDYRRDLERIRRYLADTPAAAGRT